ncbi:EF-hand [Pseudohyphozyma bogoriensis]|nr:EF-hand [Pseudohyphozyma bogoriensis]
MTSLLTQKQLSQGDFTCTLEIDDAQIDLAKVQTQGILTSARASAPFKPDSTWRINWTDTGLAPADSRVYCLGQSVAVLPSSAAKGGFENAKAGISTIRLCFSHPLHPLSANSSPRKTAANAPPSQDIPSNDTQIFFLTLISTSPVTLFPPLTEPEPEPEPVVVAPKGKGKGKAAAKRKARAPRKSAEGTASKAVAVNLQNLQNDLIDTRKKTVDRELREMLDVLGGSVSREGSKGDGNEEMFEGWVRNGGMGAFGE